jgi:hypothetical protein
VQLSPFSRHLIPPRYKYSSQNPVIKHTYNNMINFLITLF